MQTPVVTIKVSPREMQVIADALRVYDEALQQCKRGDGGATSGERIKLNVNLYRCDPREGIVLVQKMRQDLGVV